MRNILLLVLTTIALFHRLPAYAWSGAGHMVIAAEGYRSLSPELQKRVTAILESHPEYAKWKESYDRYGNGIDFATFIFMRSSTWPDEIRRGRGLERGYDHPHWHYVDYPLIPPNFPMEPEPSPHDDVLYGIGQCEKFLSDAKTSPELKAVYLSFLIHLVADMHQPLHCCSLVNSTYPKGDKGGNDFYVTPAARGIKLHSMWDGLLGTRAHEKTQFDDAIRIEAEHPRKSLPELLKDTTPKSWCLESRQLAIDKGYLHGELKGGTSIETAQPLPDGYTREAKTVAEKQAALAGYRLADVIKSVLK